MPGGPFAPATVPPQHKPLDGRGCPPPPPRTPGMPPPPRARWARSPSPSPRPCPSPRSPAATSPWRRRTSAGPRPLSVPAASPCSPPGFCLRCTILRVPGSPRVCLPTKVSAWMPVGIRVGVPLPRKQRGGGFPSGRSALGSSHHRCPADQVTSRRAVRPRHVVIR